MKKMWIVLSLAVVSCASPGERFCRDHGGVATESKKLVTCKLHDKFWLIEENRSN